MGTRADFYAGRGETAEWLGSIAWDGHPASFEHLFAAKDEAEWRRLVAKEIAEREDGTSPEQGWPWPWKDGHLTDYSYAFDGGQSWVSRFGHRWLLSSASPEWADDDGPKVAFPDMSSRAAVTLGRRSGVIVVGGR